MSVNVCVEVVRDDGLPYRGGVAVVSVDGAIVAKLRSCEGIDIAVPDPAFSVSVAAPLGLKEAPVCGQMIREPYAGRCGLPEGHAGRHRSVRVAASSEVRPA